MTNQLDRPVAMTLAIKNSMNADDVFAGWVVECLARHLAGDWGEVGLLTWNGNNDEPEQALSVYPLPPEHSHHLPVGAADEAMWIVNDGVDITTMLWPAEY